MKVLIVDDEAPARERLAQLIEDIGGHQVVGGARNGEEALTQAGRHRPDIVLMDIRMPGMDGLEAAFQLARSEEPPAVIFVTANSEHALDAFDAQAVDYLVKPVRQARLEEALDKARRLTRAQIESLSSIGDLSTGGRSQILCRRRSGLELINLDEIYYFQADNKYVTVRHAGGEDLIEDSLRQLEEEFPDRLVRIHRNALVCLHSLGGMERDRDGRRYVVIRTIEHRLEVSRRHVPEVRRLLRTLGSL